MRKKITNGLLLAVIAIAAMNIFVSCKDLAEDYYVELQGLISDQAKEDLALRDLIAQQEKALKDAKADLQAQIDALKASAATKEEVKGYVDGLQKQINDLNDAIKALKNDQVKVQDEIDALKAKVAALEGKNDCNCAAEIAALKEQIAKLAEKDAEFAAQIAKLQGEKADKADLLQEVADRKAETAVLTAAVESIQTALKNYQTATDAKLASMAQQISDNNTAIATAKTLAQQALDLAKDNASEITALKNTVKSLEDKIAGWDAKLQKAVEDAAKALALAEVNKARIEGFGPTLDSMKGDITALQAALAQAVQNCQIAQANYEKVCQDLIDAALVDVKKALADLDAADKALDQKIDGVDAKVADLTAAYKAADADLQEQIDCISKLLNNFIATTNKKIADINEEINKLWDKISDVEDELNDVENELGKFENALENAVTSVVLQGAYNPVLGWAALPFDIRMNMLAAYYGTSDAQGWSEFPTTETALYIKSDDAFSDADKAATGFNEGEVYMDSKFVDEESDNNAGKLFLTLNPADVDHSNVVVTLENSLKEESGVKLSPLAPSDEKLTFGYTRSVDNGFYEANATLDVNDIDIVKANITMDQLKEIAKDLYKNKTHANLTNIAQNVQDMLDGFLDANAVKATWTDGNGDEHYAYSEYALAATAVQPLSFSTLEDFSKTFPKVALLDGIVMHLDQMEMSPVPDLKYHFKYDDDVKDIHIDKYLTLDEVKSKLETMEVEMKKGVDELISQIEHQTNDQFGKYLNKANNLIKKVNNLISRANGIFNNANHYFQICLVYENNEGIYNQLNSTKIAPTYFKLNGAGEQGMELIPTSYTAELLAPAYRKYVAVTNVWTDDTYTTSAQDGDASCKKALELANSGANMNQVFDRDVDLVGFKTSSEYKNYVYEISYAAVDYHGFNSRKTFYVKVVE